MDNLKVPAIVEKEMNKKWSDLFSEIVVQTKYYVKSMQKTVSDTKQSMAVNVDRSARRNNLVIYNFPEDDKDTKSKDKEFINQLINDFGLEFEYQRVVSSMARMSKIKVVGYIYCGICKSLNLPVTEKYHMNEPEKVRKVEDYVG